MCLIIVEEEVNLKICRFDIKEEQNVLFIKKIIILLKKSTTFKCKTQNSRREGEPNILFSKKEKGAQLFFNEIIDGKIQICIAYKTYTAEKLMDLLHSQLITCTI